jgi:enolase-phosphatase E1
VIKAIVTDIEGTTSSITFVKDVLFPYAKAQLAGFIATHGREPEVRALLNEVCDIVGQNLSDDAIAAQLQCWIDEDRKITPLKALQGLIWAEGYQQGAFHGHIYRDAAECLQAWKAQGTDLYIYSSGSVHAQKLLFRHTDFGNLTPLFSGYFDTRIGAKQEPDSYRKISEEIGRPSQQILFLSDMEAELNAAATAGMATTQLLRPGTEPSDKHPSAATFFQIVLTS